MSEPTNRVLSGVQPSGRLHLGNYLGALKHFVRLQETHECLYCVVDLHALTVRQEPTALLANTRAIAAAYLACGIDAARHIVFAQSHVSGHTELAWLLACVARVGWLQRMTQFKDKVGRDREQASVGLYVYPVLMAADILLYRASHVPVGEDQKQHLELARDLAQKFNQDYKQDLFPLPAPLIPPAGAGARVMSLKDGAKKMSKSDAADMATIYLDDDGDAIARKIRKAKTDAAPLPSEAQGLAARAEARNLVGLYAALSDTTEAAVLAQHGGASFAQFKAQLTELAVATLVPLGENMQRHLAAPDNLDAILQDGATRARALSQPTLKAVRTALGLLPLKR